jgi:hypothetical protein
MSTEWRLDLYAPAWNVVLEHHPYIDHVEDWAATAEANVDDFDSLGVHFQHGEGDPMPIAYRDHRWKAVNACTAQAFGDALETAGRNG